jgi:RNA polymerase sigma-70 factor, ECF subfamily
MGANFLKVGDPSRHSAGGDGGIRVLTEAWPEDGLARLVERARAKDETAWRELYDAHFDFVFRVARRLGTPEAEVEDVVQDVFAVVFKKLPQFSEGRLTTWLYRITANVVSDRHRRRRVRRAFESLKLWIGGSGPESPDRLVEKSSASAAVEKVLERMTPKKREVFSLFELEGLSGDEISERLGVPVNTVWTRLHHARKEFLSVAKKLRYLETEGQP